MRCVVADQALLRRISNVSALFAELKECSSSKNLARGRVVHDAAIQCGADSNVCIANTLIDMYGKCGSLRDARTVFEGLQFRTDVSWNALILGYADNGEGETALQLFSRMRQEGCTPDSRTFVSVLKGCTDLVSRGETVQAIDRGRAIHLLYLSSGCASIFVDNTLLDMYTKCNSMEDAWRVFQEMQHRDVVSWNVLILGYADNGEGEVALNLFSTMDSRQDARSFVGALKACTGLAVKEEENGELAKNERGRALHLLALSHGCDSDIYVKNTLMDMYSKCKSMRDAQLAFDMMRNRTAVSWTALIAGYAETGEGMLALNLFSRMGYEGCTPDAVTFVAAIKACIHLAEKEKEGGDVLGARQRGRALYLLVLFSGSILNLYVQNSLVDMFGKCGSMEEARMVFEGMGSRTVVSWTILVLGYAENGQGAVALQLLPRMEREGCAPDARNFVSSLRACTDLAATEEANDRLIKVGAMEVGKALHTLVSGNGCDSDIYVNNALVDMYAKCGDMDAARCAFEKMKDRTVVSWNALILGYADCEEWNVVLQLYTRMKSGTVNPDALTCAAALKACGMVGALEFGKAVHAEMCSGGFQTDVILGNVLVDFYAKCGSLDRAEEVFESHCSRDLITWNALMAGYSRHGDTKGAFGVMERLLKTDLKPSKVTFLCALKACSHAGLCEQGQEYFEAMSLKYGLSPELEHFTCMVDLLARTNKLSDAMALLRSMPWSANAVTWMAVLGGCRKAKNVGLGRLVFQSLMSVEDKIAGPYVIMANLYGSKGMWEDQESVHATRKKLGVWKYPGQSLWTNQAGVVHTFSAGDKSHPQSEEIHAKMKDMVALMREHGYVADLSSVTRNMSDPEKEDALCGHSEKLAIACALINTAPGETIRIIKNLRVCNDCHVATALISKLEGRTILCRDASRFHVFKDGLCSCGDFW